MSRIAKDPVLIPDSVKVTAEGNTLKFNGPKGELSLDIHKSVSFLIEDSTIKVNWKSSEQAAMAGTMRSLINNYVQGVKEGYTKTITLNGVGYRAKVEGKVNVKAAVTDTSMKTFNTALKAGFTASGKKDIKE